MKTVVITGISHGLGLLIAQAFAKDGWSVVGTGRSERPADLDQAIAYHQFDASCADACADFWQEISSKVDGKICLVNNAGGYASGGLLTAAPEDYQTQMASNYFAAVYMTKGLMEGFEKARIINILSSSALAPRAWQSAYGASKAAAMHFFKAIRKEVSAQAYPITNLYPSDIATHGKNEKAIDAQDLADFILQQANATGSFYLSDVTLYPTKS